MQLHPPGDCPDSLYGADCNGVGRYGPDPYAVEIYDDRTPVWLCDGARYGRAQDI